MLSFLTGKVVEERKSPINGEIVVVKGGGDYRIEVGGLLQSGGLIKNIWQAGLKGVNFKVTRVLILGLGGGTAAKLVTNKWPGVKIVGVEIDPVIIELAKKYFAIDKIANLEIIQAEAIGWVKEIVWGGREKGEKWERWVKRGKEEMRETEALHPRTTWGSGRSVGFRVKFDLIIVDLYLGDQFPKEAEKEDFLENLKKLLSSAGVVIFNRLFWGEKKKEAEIFVKLLENHFPKITLKKTPCNLLIFCRT